MKILCTLLLTLVCYSSISSSPVKNDEDIIFIPTYAFKQKNNIIINMHAWVFEPEPGAIKRTILTSTLIKLLKLKNKDLESRQFKENSFYFMVDNERNKEINISLGGYFYPLSKTKPNGHSTTTLTIPQQDFKKYLHNNTLTYSAITRDQRTITGKVHYSSPRGLSVISDIDDTIKISNVLNKKELARNTFIRKFMPVPGMAGLYNKWHSITGTSFHYVSGSPWQLYVPIARFLHENGFPLGSFHMKHFRLKNSSSFKFIMADQMAYKVKLIAGIIKDFPLRDFILVGDSGESDPEVYAQIAAQFPAQVKAIYIRDVGSKSKDPLRYKKLFSNMKDITWKVFKTSAELQ